MNVSDIDLKSLEVLEALVVERNVTRAARKVGLSQPAVSNTLARLRRLLDDPLLVRTHSGMVPTSRAQALVAPIRQAMDLLETALTPASGFDPARARAHFRVAATDYAAWMLLPRLCAGLAQGAPGVQLEVTPLVEKVPARDLERGEIDLALGFFPDPPPHLYQQELFTEDFVAVVGSESPHAKGRMTVERFASLRHVLVTPWGGMVGTMDSELARKGLKRTISVSLTHFLVAPAIVERTEYVVTLPRRLAQSFASTREVRIVELPLELPGLVFRQLWHGRTHAEPAHQWLRGKVGEACRPIGKGPR